jgi:serine/threonine protein kinase
MKRGRLTEREASLVVRDIANGLNFLHSKGMSHRFVRKKQQTRYVNIYIIIIFFLFL